MSNTLTTALVLEAVGIALLVGEIFLPSHGVLIALGLGSLGVGLYAAFQFSLIVGYVSLLLALVLVPTFAVMAVRLWPKTFIGKRIAPPNLEFLRSESPGDGSDALRGLIGQTGMTLTPLRPVGACDFGGRRVECLAESGMIDRKSKVVAIDVQGQSLVVRPA
jgi:membrane-bound ClpP family serine protease